MQRKNMWGFALLAVAACADGGGSGAEDPAWDPANRAPAADVMGGGQQDALGAAGMAAPGPNEATDDTATGGDDARSPSAMEAADGDGEPLTDPQDAEDTDAPEEARPDPISDGSSSPDADASDPSLPTPTTPPASASPAVDTPPTFTSLADLAPAATNIPECPATAPENPWGPCVGVPVYAVCDYGTAPAPFYTCVCDWIHWICVGFQ